MQSAASLLPLGIYGIAPALGGGQEKIPPVLHEHELRHCVGADALQLHVGAEVLRELRLGAEVHAVCCKDTTLKCEVNTLKGLNGVCFWEVRLQKIEPFIIFVQ